MVERSLLEKMAARYKDGAEYRTSGGRHMLRLASEDGAGSMLFYEVMPGIMLAYCDFSMGSCLSLLEEPERDMLCVDHCREGRLEQTLSGGACEFVSTGDLKIDDRSNHEGLFGMPLGEYRGITVSFEIDRAQRSLAGMIEGFHVDLHALRRRFCPEGRPFVVHGAAEVNHIFSELYSVPEGIRDVYFKLKVCELLLFLEMLDPDAALGARRYYPASHVEKVKAAHDALVADLSAPCSIEGLARRYGMPLTAFKACFKGVYGVPPYAYLKAFRMERAAQLLRETDRRIADVALEVGYESPSKFAAAFKQQFDVTPSAYRRG